MSAEDSSGHEHNVAPAPPLGAELAAHQMFCLHGVALDSDDILSLAGTNSLLPSDTTLHERFRMAIEERPTLSAVAHNEPATTSHATLWGNIGVVIADGDIQAARSGDLSSVMSEGGARKTREEQSPSDIAAALDRIAALDERYPKSPEHNEVVVRDPSIAAVYFKDTAGLMPNQINRAQTTADSNTVPELVREVGEEFGLPIFAIRTSGVYEVKHFDPVTGIYRLGTEDVTKVHAGEIASAHISGDQTAAHTGAVAIQGA